MARLRRELRVRAGELLTVAPCPTTVRQQLGFELGSGCKRSDDLASAADAVALYPPKQKTGFGSPTNLDRILGPYPATAVICAKRGQCLERAQTYQTAALRRMSALRGMKPRRNADVW